MITNKAPTPNFHTKRISIFKNGIAFFHKNGEVDASGGQVKFDELPIGGFNNRNDEPVHPRDRDFPSVIFGSVWFSSTTNPLLRTSVFSEEAETQEALLTLTDLFSHNLRKTIDFSLKNDPSSYAGKIMSMQDGVLLIRMNTGWKQVAIEALDRFDFEDQPNLYRNKVAKKTVLQLDFAQSQKVAPIDLMYFQKGLSWLPNYHVQLLGNHKARISLKANVFNEVEDLKDVAVNFVLGIPSFSDIQEPLFSGQSLRSFMSDLARNPRSSSSHYTDSVMTQVRASANYQVSEDPFLHDPDTEGEMSDEDLFFYTKENLTLPRGGRMLIHLLETDISYDDSYSVRLDKDLRTYGRQSHRSSNTVWHSLTFKNESGLPLPTGAISFVKDENGSKYPISQNHLDFVPAGLLAKVKMTEVPDIVVMDDEKVKDTQQNGQDEWKLLTIEGVVEVSNFKKKEITLEIERAVAGELLESDTPWTKGHAGRQNLNSPNQSNEVNWVLSLQPGEKKTITYRYKHLIFR